VGSERSPNAHNFIVYDGRSEIARYLKCLVDCPGIFSDNAKMRRRTPPRMVGLQVKREACRGWRRESIILFGV